MDALHLLFDFRQQNKEVFDVLLRLQPPAFGMGFLVRRGGACTPVAVSPLRAGLRALEMLP